ncbi:MAG: hypothetical protein IPJ40_23390 [Saprospirales bacterium]|nr:hypothetical protein [Saprospirales bacterium]
MPLPGVLSRFESYEKVLRVSNLGQGIRYMGGFRLQGTTVYGFGTRETPAQLEILDNDKVLRLRASAELFTIRREERITGDRVSATLYFGQDSLYHPSVNFRFEIPKQQLELTRGDRGSDRNPFFSSLHNINIDSDKINFYVKATPSRLGRKVWRSAAGKPRWCLNRWPILRNPTTTAFKILPPSTRLP